MNKIISILATLVLSGILSATAVYADSEIHYAVKEGETLSGIAADMLKKTGHWRQLQQINQVADPHRLMPGTTLRIPVALLRTEPATAIIISMSGEVLANGRTPSVGDAITGQTTLITGEQGFVTLELIDGSRLVLQPESRLRVEELSRYRGTKIPDSQLHLERGRIESTVTKSSASRPKYRINTPTTAMGVRGTRFRVEADGSVSRAEVTEGAVDVHSDKSAATAVPAGYGIVTNTGSALPRPVALLPKPDVSGLPYLHEHPIVRFALPPLDGARAYRFQIGADPEMHELLADASATRPEAKFGHLPDGEYILRVRGIDAQGLEGLDSDFRFQLKARPEPPFPAAPPRDAKVRAASVELAWTINPDAARYRLQIASDKTFTDIVADIDGIEGNTIMPARQLPPGDYFWRMRSIRAGGDSGPWNDAQHFRMDALPAGLPPPTLSNESLTFAWVSEPGQTFLFQLARDAAFTSIAIEQQVAEPTITIARPPPDTYYTRVRATDADGFVGPYTQPQIINVPYPPPPWWFPILLLLPVVL
ncbi:MAG: FecR domain-containing protein [Zoogloeaceae bacterium]|jgi:hypothetical protein|nr:FecR domain-containing protein [Zoogloeaceae bacterium]